MTKQELEQYKSAKSEIRELQRKLTELSTGKTMIDHDVIIDYRSGLPMPQSVVGVDWSKVFQMERRYKKRIAQLEDECQIVELWVEEIPDSLTRRIFRMRYIEEKSQSEIGDLLNFDRSSVSKKIDRYIKHSHNSHNSHV